MSERPSDSGARDWTRLVDWLEAHLPGFEGPLVVQAFDFGQSNPTYELRTPARSYVLRSKPVGRLLASAHAVDREFRVLSALHPTGLPVPRPDALCEDEDVIGAMFYVMEKADGRILHDPLLAELAPSERRPAYLSMVEALARLHSLEPQAVGLEDFGRAGNYMGRQVERWTKQYRASTNREIPAMERLIAWLPQTIPAQTRTSIVHGDYKLDNVMFARAEPRLVAILDWELSTIGDPLCDFTYMLLNWVSGPIVDLPDPGVAGVPSREELVSAYCRLTSRQGLPDLEWFFSYNLFRLAAIIEGVVGRAREGTARDPRAAALADRPPLMAEAAWRIAQRAGA